MSPEKHFSDGWIQNERMLTNISSGTFWNYWHNPSRSTGNGFSIKTMWNGFKYSWNKSRKKLNSQDRCDVLPGRGMSRTQPYWQLHKTLRRQSQPKPQHGWGADLQAYPSPRSYSSRWLLGWGVTLYWGYGGRGVSSGQPYSHARMSNTQKTSWILRNKTHDIGGRVLRGAEELKVETVGR